MSTTLPSGLPGGPTAHPTFPRSIAIRLPVLVFAAALVLALVVPAPALATGRPAGTAYSVSVAAATPPTVVRKAAATPPVQYQVKKSAPLRATASASGRKLATVKQGAFLVTLSTKRGWVRASVEGKTGWFPLANTKRLQQHRHEALRKTSLRKSPGKGAVVAVVARGQALVSTGRTSGTHTQLYAGGKTGWARTADIRRSIVAKYQTSSATALYASARSVKQLARIPADYTLGSLTNARSNGRVEVVYAGSTGWVKSSKAAKVAGNVRLGRLSWEASAAKNIAKWCRGVPITAGPNRPNEAEASGWIGNMKERISLDTNGFRGKKLDPNHPLAISIQYHECAHILQYRAYKYDFTRMDRAMDKVYGKPRTAAGTEHMADCMAVAMGARLKGSEADPRSGYTTTWYSGYGGACTSRHLAAARTLIAGRAL
ncbi:hypothetical protein ACIPVK_06775 [Paeniglutamicibacter sp. MACA_103]|uniref:hypothetical protein n=1 Tax=Paeniglutamicibacter sp. MACA_103 TaxID=3377337 RepID=UPI003894C134